MPIFSYLQLFDRDLSSATLYFPSNSMEQNFFHSNCPGIYTSIVHPDEKVFIQCFHFWALKKVIGVSVKGPLLCFFIILSEANSQIAFRKLTLLSCQCLILDAKQTFLCYTKNSSNCATCARLSRVYNCGIPGFLVVLDVVAKVTPKAIWRPQMVKNVKIEFAAFNA